MSKKPFFTGPFAPICESYVAQKRASGLDYNQQAKLLRLFDNFCKGYEIQNYTITKEIALTWCKKRPNEADATRYSRVSEMQRFAQYLCKQGYPSYLLSALPKCGEQHVPYIFQWMSCIVFLNGLTHSLRLICPLTDILLCHSCSACSMAVAFEFPKRWLC